MGTKKLTMYVSILDYNNNKVVVCKVPHGTDIEDYVSENFGLDNVEYMTSEVLSLEILTN